jgi:hypothetical protein
MQVRLAIVRRRFWDHSNAAHDESRSHRRFAHSSMAARVGFSATISREPRQARKGATVTVISGAGEAPARAVSSNKGRWVPGYWLWPELAPDSPSRRVKFEPSSQ